MLPPELRFPDGSQEDYLAYFIWLCEDGLFQLMTPLGDGLDLTESYANAKAFWFDAQHWRPIKKWYQNLTGWVDRSICTADELGVLVMTRRLQKLGVISVSQNAETDRAISLLGATPDPWPEHQAMLRLTRENSRQQNVTPADLLAGLRTLELYGPDVTKFSQNA